MNKDRIIYLCQCYLDNSASEDELREFESVLADPQQDALLKKTFDSSYYTLVRSQQAPVNEVAKENSFKYIISQPQSKRLRSFWPRFVAAASILLILGFGSYFLIKKQQPPQIAQNQKQDLDPGGNHAILTLANGQKIILTGIKNGQLASQNGALINKTADGHVVYQPDPTGSKIVYNTMSTPRGGQYHLTLADGTNVWLDAASSITYPVAFRNTDREVTITGQVYFEVAHKATVPFRVKVKGQTVQDIGTHFNINAYDDESSIKTTLLEGSIKVSKDDVSKILVPGEQAFTSAANVGIKISQVDTEGVIAWKEGHFHFDSDDIQTVMRQLARWYDVDVEYSGSVPVREFSGNINRNTKASAVLKILSLSKVNFKIDGKKIIVTPK
ncbi:FecR family protein [Mucilaginibacter polytrichastri]|uniref:FecR protein domain-containing protein n=1 Tax=Mucilaginibacter polytrichastri TaxID=1302689 RepID=A0A1Q6A429_9SPHI|nr:FecR family protein [Mucilaginibacter polytrichastri]OKS88771.1 hypothetical protein RG47T_4249 [Mucilaginibacter polytrichastri]SFT05465.1 FecR family protein [Mucilaginibacter polytrichastri]